MPDATSSSLGAGADNQTEQSTQSLPQVPSTNYSCTSCQISFQNGQEQRAHMKEPWHVYNLKQRIASLPPISLEEFNAQAEKNIEKSEAPTKGRFSGKADSRVSSGSDGEVSDDEDEETASPFQCLFCNRDFANDDEGFEENLEHMHTAHGMSIPDPELVLDMQSLVGYLATEVRVWHECLYCGATKSTTLSIQNHMKDKGHCLLNLDREPELLDFWESPESEDEDEGEDAVPEQERPTNLSATEMRFASGKVIGSRHAALATKKASRKRTLAASTAGALPPGSEEAESSLLAVGPQLASQQLARRQEMSIAGISVQQRQALVLAEKKAQRTEAVARRAREWVYAKAANSQKFDQLDNQMKMGKQNHKLLPR